MPRVFENLDRVEILFTYRFPSRSRIAGFTLTTLDKYERWILNFNYVPKMDLYVYNI